MAGLCPPGCSLGFASQLGVHTAVQHFDGWTVGGVHQVEANDFGWVGDGGIVEAQHGAAHWLEETVTFLQDPGGFAFQLKCEGAFGDDANG
jgi:hypothetical protein